MTTPFRKTQTTITSGAIAAVVLGLVVLAQPTARAAEDSANPVWFISTRQLPPAGKVDETPVEEFLYYRLLPDGAWEESGREAFLADTDPAVPTTLFIHGNLVGPSGAVRDAWRIHRRMKRDADGRPFRLVVWSWPAGRVCRRMRPDIQVKACRSDTQGYYLARLLADMPHDSRVALVGYSFGARIITGALHVLAGGEVAGLALEAGRSGGIAAVDKDAEPKEQPEIAARKRLRFRAVLVAAAMSAGSLSPDCRNGLATTQVERILVTRNGCDRALKWYPRLYGRGGPEAMGYAGACCCGTCCCDTLCDKIEQIDVTCSVGRSHSWASYTCSEPLMQRLAQYTFLTDDPPLPAVLASTSAN